MATMHMLIGIPGSGKSTYSKEILIPKYKDAIYVASDKVRDNNPDMDEDHIWPEIYRLLSEALNANKDVIFDATNITPEVRNNVKIELAKRNATSYKMIAYYFITDPNKCYTRVTKRNLDPNERYLPVEIIDGYGKRIIPPTKDEGFEEIYIIDNNKDK